MNKRIVRLNTVMDMVGLSRSSIYRRLDNGSFPKPVDLGSGTIGWVENEIISWIDERIAQRDVSDGV